MNPKKPIEITESDVDEIVNNLPENFTIGDMLTSIVGALNKNESATIKDSTIKSFSEKKAKEHISKLDTNNPEEAKQIELIKSGLTSSEGILNQIGRIDKKGNEINIVPVNEKIVIKNEKMPVAITIEKNNSITIDEASSSGIKLTIKGIGTIAGRVKSANLTSKGYSVKMGGIAPNQKGEW